MNLMEIKMELVNFTHHDNNDLFRLIVDEDDAVALKLDETSKSIKAVVDAVSPHLLSLCDGDVAKAEVVAFDVAYSVVRGFMFRSEHPNMPKLAVIIDPNLVKSFKIPDKAESKFWVGEIAEGLQ